MCCSGSHVFGERCSTSNRFLPYKHFSLPYVILLKEKSEEEERNPFHPPLLFSQKLQILSTKPPSFLAGLRLPTDGTGDEKDRSL